MTDGNVSLLGVYGFLNLAVTIRNCSFETSITKGDN